MKTTDILLLILLLIVAGCLFWRFGSEQAQLKGELVQLRRADDEQTARIRLLERERDDREAEKRVFGSLKRLVSGLLPKFLRIEG